MSKYIPELVHQFYPAEEAQINFRVSDQCVGAITYPIGQLNSYKMITQIMEILLDKGVNLQTNTPVNKVSRHGSRWIVETDRGTIDAAKVIHATNGYIQHLIPSFTVITPNRGHVTARAAPVNLSKTPLDKAYCFIYGHGEHDYMIQLSANEGNKLIIGGGYNEDPQPGTDDDGRVNEQVFLYLRSQVEEVMQWREDNSEKFYMEWSGIMGFSADELPWVGCLPETLEEEGQWICAGYSGEGESTSGFTKNNRNVECPPLYGIVGFYASWKRTTQLLPQIILSD